MKVVVIVTVVNIDVCFEVILSVLVTEAISLTTFPVLSFPFFLPDPFSLTVMTFARSIPPSSELP